jgi:hypothetical protein
MAVVDIRSVALANKMARIAFAVLRGKTVY